MAEEQDEKEILSITVAIMLSALAPKSEDGNIYVPIKMDYMRFF